MNDVIDTILQAEARAEEIVRAGEQEAGRILAEGEAVADKIAADAQARLLSEQEERLAAAEEAAQPRYAQICNEGAARAEALRASCEDMLPQAADMVVRKVFGE